MCTHAILYQQTCKGMIDIISKGCTPDPNFAKRFFGTSVLVFMYRFYWLDMSTVTPSTEPSYPWQNVIFPWTCRNLRVSILTSHLHPTSPPLLQWLRLPVMSVVSSPFLAHQLLVMVKALQQGWSDQSILQTPPLQWLVPASHNTPRTYQKHIVKKTT